MVRVITAGFSYLVAATALAAPQNDFDADGVSDLTFTSGTTTLTWSATGSTSTTDELDAASFGLATDALALAPWETAGTPTLGVVRANTDNTALVWKILNNHSLVSQEEFGKPGDVMLAGGDFDGGGISDAAVVRLKGSKLRWEVRLNLFVDDVPTTKRFFLGKDGDRVFYLNLEGSADWAGVFGKDSRGRSRMLLRNVLTGEKRAIRRLPKALTRGVRPRPFPIQAADGRDLIGFAIPDATDTSLKVYSTDAEEILNITFPGLGTIIVGNYDDDEDGEEVGLESSTTITFVNPSTTATSTKAAVSGTPLDEIEVVQVSAGTAG